MMTWLPTRRVEASITFASRRVGDSESEWWGWEESGRGIEVPGAEVRMEVVPELTDSEGPLVMR